MVGITQLQSAALMGSPIIAQQEQIKRARALAQALRDASMQQEGTQMVSGRAIPYQPMQGVAKLIQALGGGITDYYASQQEKELGDQMRTSRAEALKGGDPEKMLESSDPLLNALGAHLLAKRQGLSMDGGAEYGKSPTFVRTADGKVIPILTDSAGNVKELTQYEQPPQAPIHIDTGSKELLVNRTGEPIKEFEKGMTPEQTYDRENPPLSSVSTSDGYRTFNPRSGRYSQPAADDQGNPIKSPTQIEAEAREAERRRKLAERAYNIELAQWEKENPTYRQDETKLKDAEVNKKKLDDAADNLLSNLKATTGDRMPNFQVGPLNADRARELQNAYQALLWNIRSPEMANTGVLNPGEIPMLEQAIADPTSLRNVGQTEAIIKQIEELKKTASRNYETMRDVFGKRAPPPKFDPNAEVDLPESYLSDMEKSLGTSPKSAPATAKPSVDDLLKKYGRK